jgi:signal transduction histidine kinase
LARINTPLRFSSLSQKTKSILLIALVAATAAVLAIASYQYYQSSIERITELAREDIQYNTQVQSKVISKALGNDLEHVEGNLRTLTVSPAIYRNDTNRFPAMFGSRQDVTKEISDFYVLASKDGKIYWISGDESNNRLNSVNNNTSNNTTRLLSNSQILRNMMGSDVSNEAWFVEAKLTGKPYQSPPVKTSSDGIQRLFISYPLIDGDGIFHGVVAAGIPIDKLTSLLQSDLFPKYQSRVGIIDKNGFVMSSEDPSRVGQSVFGDEFKGTLDPVLAPGELPLLEDFFKKSVNDEPATVELTFSGVRGIFAGYPIVTRGGQHHFGTITVRTYYTLAKNVQDVLEEQRFFGFIVPAIVGVVAAAIVIIVLSWNKNLQKAVDEKTRDLRAANELLLDKTEELEAANQQLKVHGKMQTEFINIAAHELRMPVQPILAIIDLLKNRSESAEKNVEISTKQVEILDRNAKRLQRLSSEILDATRIEAGTLKLEMEVLDIDETIRNTIADAESWLPQEKRLQIYFKPALVLKDEKTAKSVPLLVKADRLRIFEVISNLLRNAIKFSGPDGIIAVTTEKQDGQVLISVKDQGVGISADLLPRLFTRFSADKEKGGTGLGLYIAKNIIEAHGGKIWAENYSDGKIMGAAFFFTILIIIREEVSHTLVDVATTMPSSETDGSS